MFEVTLTKEAEEATYTGLFLQCSASLSLDDARVEWEKSILGEAERLGFPISSGLPFLVITMPCGTEVHYQTFGDIPVTDTPCPCGDARHWLVRYGFIEEGGDKKR